MPYITKNNYHIGFGERFIRVFSDVYNQSWHSEYIADLTASFKKTNNKRGRRYFF